jgi:hypothetical protein
VQTGSQLDQQSSMMTPYVNDTLNWRANIGLNMSKQTGPENLICLFKSIVVFWRLQSLSRKKT